jgi:hypothetical protein
MFDRKRYAPIEMLPEDFRTIGYRLVDRIAELRDSLPVRPVTAGQGPPARRRQAGAFALPACLINFRTSLEDIPALPGLVVRLGRGVDAILITALINNCN